MSRGDYGLLSDGRIIIAREWGNYLDTSNPAPYLIYTSPSKRSLERLWVKLKEKK